MSAATVLGPGHPDQACDLVVASVVEEYLRRDPESRLNIRACGGKGVLFLAGEVSSTADFDVSAVIKQTLAACGVFTPIEPFIAFEPMLAPWANVLGSREPTVVESYATHETPELLPKALVLARKLAQALEQKRTMDQDWFWLGTDYEVRVLFTNETRPLVLIRAEHLESVSLEQVRLRIQSVCEVVIKEAEFRINTAGEETQAGLAHRVGSSARSTGLPIHHPQVAGTLACRALARRLVKEGKGKAVAVRATWLPLETRASFVRLWNEAGHDLSSFLRDEELEITRLPQGWLAPETATRLLKQGADPTQILPWEI
jgi:hypothetical protein